MPRREIPLQPGNFYHIYNRVNNHQTIFFERENYIYFLKLLRKHLIINAIDIIAYCLMPNHYHLLVYLRDETLSEAMKSLSIAYTKAINKRFNRSGVLFQGRFQSIHVAKIEYLINFSRYIHLNPVKAALVQQPEEWEFSSYLEYTGLRAGTLPRPDYIRMQFDDESSYQQFLVDCNLPHSIDFKKLLLDD
ncbi:MAG: transposase [Nostoc sp. TH1S01]|nr:transposase [Nostoc sp. TH1S01]